ncbi:MAG: outer membrane protein assembly factor [Schleiferiaceae bacterium]|nr:outer membrane protein assembly factor [Schleiferiaceae bacterium]
MRNKSFILLVLLLVAACSPTKNLKQNERLFEGGQVTVVSAESKLPTKLIERKLQDLIRPQPASKFEMWSYRLGQKEKKWFMDRYLSRRFGVPPVIDADIDAERLKRLMENRLENNGFFHYSIAYEWKDKRKQRKNLYFNVVLTDPYRLENYEIDTVNLPNDFVRMIALSMRETVLKPGSRYELDKLKEERSRIDAYLKNRGFYNFTGDYLLFYADTNHYKDRKFDLYLSVKENVPKESLKPHVIQNVKVRANYQVRMPSDSTVVSETDSAVYRGVVYLNPETFEPEHLHPYLYITPGVLFSQFQQNRTLSRIGSMGTFRFATVRYTRADTLTSDTVNLTAELLLSPMNRRSVGIEMQGVTKSNNFMGPGVVLNYRNRNLFRGGEILNVNVKTSFETQVIRGEQTGLNSVEIGAEAELIFPRMTPFQFGIIQRARYGVPVTKTKISYTLLNRAQLYSLTSALASYGFSWQPTQLITQEWHPISINLLNTYNITPEFEEILMSNPFLRRSFERQFILGSTYSLQYNGLLKEKKHRFFVNFTADVSGFMLTGYDLLVNNDAFTLLGLPYAQYARFDFDVRHYYQMPKSRRLVSRVFIGRSFPFSNSVSLPYIKQYFSGGPNSVRAFRIRSLGPGTYRSAEFGAASFFDQAGDIKLEGNMEYRHNIAGLIKGAVFLDVGNVWLVNDNPSLPGGQFSSSWFSELAVGVGYGVRFDLDFFVLRFDLAMPLHKPFRAVDNRWVAADISPWLSRWRRENLILNFAIGYPF